MRHNALRYSLLYLLALLTSPLWAAVSATVDRTEIAMDESFTLTITVSELRVFTQPDLSPLETDFEVLGTSQSSNTSISNGKLKSSTSWTVQLMPKRPGKTSIPPVSIGKEQTHSIEIIVLKGGQGRAANSSENVLLEAELSTNTAYVTAQVLLTLRVSMAQPARFQLEEPELGSAIVQQVAEASYQQVRGSRRFQVTEYTFAIFPGEPGELVIEPLNLVAELMSSRPRSMFDPMQGQGRRVLKRTEPLTLNVIPAPDGINRVDWLPATDVSLEQEWSQDINTLQVGDSITRTIELKGKGVMAAQLPPLFISQVKGLKMYPDQPVVTDEQNASGITGKRVERIAMVATLPGIYQLPEQRIQWWDVNKNQMEAALLPAVSFRVAAPAQSPATLSPTTAEQTEPGADSRPAQAGRDAGKAWYQYPLWWAISVLLLLACVALAVLYFRARRQITTPTQVTEAVADGIDTEKQAYGQLRAACDDDSPAAIYQALQHWCRLHWKTSTAPGLDQLEQYGANRELVDQATGLQQQLYGNGQAGRWDAATLLQAVDQQRQSREKGADNKPSLPPLYH